MTRLPDLHRELPVRPSIGDLIDRVAELHARVVHRRLLREELRFGAFDVRLVGFDERRRGVGLRLRELRRVLRQDAALRQLALALGGDLLIFRVGGVAIELRFGLRFERLVAAQLRFGLRQRRFEGTPIEREEQLAGLHEIALVERDLLQLPGHLRADRNGGVCLDVADCGDVHGHVALRHLGGDHRRIAAAAADPRPPRPPPLGVAADVPPQPARARAATPQASREIKRKRFSTSRLQRIVGTRKVL